MNPSRSVVGQASFIGAAALGGAVIGFFLQLLIAYYFGAGATTDAFFMASSLSELLTKLLMGGSVAAVFLPMFIQHLAAGQRATAWQLALNIIHITTGLFGILLIAVGLLARPIVSFVAPGFDAATQALTVQILYVLLPSFLIFFVVDLLTTILHAVQQFTIPALLRLLAPAVSIAALLLLHSLGIYALAIGVVMGSVCQLIFIMVGLNRQNFHYRWQLQPNHPEMRRLLFLVYPFIFSMLTTQLAGIVYRILVSELSPGSLSAIKYAEKITQLLTVIFISSVTTVLYPRLAHAVGKRDYEGMVQTLAAAMRLLLLLTLPLWIGASVLRDSIIRFIYERGSFSPEAVSLTSQALLFLSISLWTNAVSSLLGHTVLALQRTRAAVAVTVASQAVAICLFVILVPRLQHAGLALASSLVPLVSAALYFIYIMPILPQSYRLFWQGSLLKIVLLGLGLFVLLWAWVQFILPPVATVLPVLLQLLLPTLVGGSGFFIAAYFWGIDEVRDLALLMRRRVEKLPWR